MPLAALCLSGVVRELNAALARVRNQTLGEIYLQLAALRRELVRNTGYDS